VPLLAQVPLVSELREGGDVGRPIVVVDPADDASQAFFTLAERIDVELAPTRRYHPELKLS
jgi:ATP-binding protein involved in chromosome partitioning